MLLRPFLVPLSAAALLLSTLACSKKDEPAATVATGSYKLDATTVTGQPKAYASTSSSGGLSYDYLLVELPATAQLATGAPVLQLYFVKPSTATQYGLSDMSFRSSSTATTFYACSVDAATLTPASDGSYAGTFAGKIITPSGGTPAPYTTITSGIFTGVRP